MPAPAVTPSPALTWTLTVPPTPTETSTPTPTQTGEPTITPTPTVTVTPSVTCTVMPRRTRTPVATATPALTATPPITPTAVLTLGLAVTPALVLPGEVATVDLRVGNAGADASGPLSVTLLLPGGVDYPGTAEPVPGLRRDPDRQGLIWALKDLAASTQERAEMQVQVEPGAAGALEFKAWVGAGAELVTATATLQVIPEQVNQVLLRPGFGGTFASADGWVRIEVPVGAVTQTALLTYRPVFTETIPGWT
jgi:hypothetical protein